jgi:hypothetical protein
MKSILMVAAVVLTTGVLAVGVHAATTTAYFDRTSGYYSDNGGEYTINPFAGNAPLGSGVFCGTASDINGNSFQSFCVEYTETISIPGTWWVSGVTTHSVFGGQAGQDGVDELGRATDSLDLRTAYLYYNFRQGTLIAPYDYAPGDGLRGQGGSSRELQRAIWYIENEIGANKTPEQALGAGTDALAFYEEATDAVARGDWNDYHGVRIMNVWKHATLHDFEHRSQDMLTLVPVPAAALLGAIGLALVGVVRRRRI